MKFFTVVGVPDVITSANFCDYQLTGSVVMGRAFVVALIHQLNQLTVRCR